MLTIEKCCLKIPCVRSYLERAVARHFTRSIDDQGASDLARVVEALGLESDDLMELLDDEGIDLPDTPSGNECNLVCAGGRVFRADQRSLGRVRLVGDVRRDVHELRVDSETNTRYNRLFGGVRVYLLAQSASSGRRVAIGCATSTLCQRFECDRPVGPVRHTMHGTDHPCDDQLLAACTFLLQHAHRLNAI